MTRVFCDFETRSKAPLKKVGGRVYNAHASTEVICAVLCWDTSEPARQGSKIIWTPGEPVPELPQPFDAVAHNAIGFDRFVWSRLGWPEPRRWIDTAQLARVAGFAKASLEWLGHNLIGLEKDTEASKLTRSLSACFPTHTRRKVGGVYVNHPHPRAGQWRLDPIPPDVLKRVVDYCALDVEILAGLFPYLEPFLDVDADIRDADLTVNDRGIEFHRELADVLIDAAAHLAREAQAAAGVDAGDVKSIPKLLDALEYYLGYRPDNGQATTLEEIAEDPECPEGARLIIEARLGSSTIAAGKLKAGLLGCSDDGRLRDVIAYYGAHTGRWAGRKIQPHNLPK